MTSVQTSSFEPAVLARGELLSMYEAYRRRQIRGLVSMLPRGAIRPLYRAALEARGTAASPDDPLEALVDHCSGLLPLPTFEVWADDWPDSPLPTCETSTTPSTDRLRRHRRRSRFAICGSVMSRGVRGCAFFRAEGAWRGFIAFEGASIGDDCRTAVIFREATPEELRERFIAFDGHALEAFLRSCLP